MQRRYQRNAVTRLSIRRRQQRTSASVVAVAVQLRRHCVDLTTYDLPNLSVTVEQLVVDCVQRLTCVDFTYNVKVFLTDKYSSVHRGETDVSLTRLGADRISRTAGASSTSPMSR